MKLNKKIQWFKQSDADNYLFNNQFLGEHVCVITESNLNKLPWIFSHIPKTGGTSLENYLAQLFLLQDVLHVNAPDLNKMPDILQLKKTFPRFIAGHHPLHGLLYQLLPDEKFVHLTMLREPVARVISYYNYLSTRESHAKHLDVVGRGFDEFLNINDMVELHNGQSRRLAGLLHSDDILTDELLFKKAKHVVDHCFTLVGVTEKFDEFLKFIEKKCDIKFSFMPRKNPSEIILTKEELTEEQLQKVMEHNAADILLYDNVLKKFDKLFKNI